MKIKLLDNNCMLFRKYKQDAGWDLKCRIREKILPGETVKIPSGICVEIPPGYVGDISPRSSASANGLIIQGKVDAGYTGEVKITVINPTNEYKIISQYERIAQLVVMRILDEELEIIKELEESERGSQGFGSTGV